MLVVENVQSVAPDEVARYWYWIGIRESNNRCGCLITNYKILGKTDYFGSIQDMSSHCRGFAACIAHRALIRPSKVWEIGRRYWQLPNIVGTYKHVQRRIQTQGEWLREREIWIARCTAHARSGSGKGCCPAGYVNYTNFYEKSEARNVQKVV